MKKSQSDSKKCECRIQHPGNWTFNRTAKERIPMSDREGGYAGRAATYMLIGLGAGAVVGYLASARNAEGFRRSFRSKLNQAKDVLGQFAEQASEQIGEALERGAEWAAELEKEAPRRMAPLGRALRKS
jgi:hypothetical protein